MTLESKRVASAMTPLRRPAKKLEIGGKEFEGDLVMAPTDRRARDKEERDDQKSRFERR